MPETATARCHCGGVEIVATFPSRFCSHCWGDEMHLPLALFVTPVDRVPTVNSFPDERPPWAPLQEFDHA